MFDLHAFGLKQVPAVGMLADYQGLDLSTAERLGWKQKAGKAGNRKPANPEAKYRLGWRQKTPEGLETKKSARLEEKTVSNFCEKLLLRLFGSCLGRFAASLQSSSSWGW